MIPIASAIMMYAVDKPSDEGKCADRFVATTLPIIMPATSDIVLPRPAEKSMLTPIAVPIKLSILSPAITIIALSTKPKTRVWAAGSH